METFSDKATRWIGSIHSLVAHTLAFLFCLMLVLFGVNFDKVLLVVTTIVSLEAIYLAIFIQMSVNRQDQHLYAVSEDIDEIQKDVDEIQEDVEEIQGDVEDIQENVEDIQEDVEDIQEDVEDIGEDVEEISEDEDDEARFARIEKNLEALMKEIGSLKKTPAKKK